MHLVVQVWAQQQEGVIALAPRVSLSWWVEELA